MRSHPGIQPHQITAVILAGGRGHRMGDQDKGLVKLAGKPLIEHVLTAVHPQVGKLLISANRNLQQYGHYGYPVISDAMADYQGPLAGFASAMSAVDTDYMITLPCDTPLLPCDLVQRLIQAQELSDGADLSVAHDGTRMQRVIAFMPVALLPDLQAFLDRGDRQIGLWYSQHKIALADFSDMPDAFLNINTPEECNQLQQSGLIKNLRPPAPL